MAQAICDSHCVYLFQKPGKTLRIPEYILIVEQLASYIMIQMENPEGKEGIPDIIDNVCDNLEIGFQMIFSPIPSRY